MPQSQINRLKKRKKKNQSPCKSESKSVTTQVTASQRGRNHVDVKRCWLLCLTKRCKARWFLPSHCGSHTRWSISPRLFASSSSVFIIATVWIPASDPHLGLSWHFSRVIQRKMTCKWCKTKLCVCVFACCIMSTFSMHESEFKEKENDKVNRNVRACMCVYFTAQRSCFSRISLKEHEKKTQEHCMCGCVFL